VNDLIDLTRAGAETSSGVMRKRRAIAIAMKTTRTTGVRAGSCMSEKKKKSRSKQRLEEETDRSIERRRASER